MKLLARNRLTEKEKDRIYQMGIRFMPIVGLWFDHRDDIHISTKEVLYTVRYHWYEFVMTELLRWIVQATIAVNRHKWFDDIEGIYHGDNAAMDVSTLFDYIHQVQQNKPNKHIVDILYELIEGNNHNFAKKYQK